MCMAGWIKISRDIQSHWIYQDPQKLKWWLDLLLLANFEDKDVVIKFKVFRCKRGQLLYSLKTLSQRWNVSKTVVNNFLEMLRKQNMIETENETVSTRITICNYETYQRNENANETQTKRKRNANETQQSTTKEYKEIKELKNNIKKNIYDEKIVNEFERFNSWIDSTIPDLRKIKKQITIDEYVRIRDKFNGEQIRNMLTAIANYRDSDKKYLSVNLTFLKWAKKEYNG